MRNKLQRASGDILSWNNIDLYLAILASVVIAGLSIFGVVDLKYVIPSLLFVMGIISYNLLLDRWHQEDFRARMFPITSWEDNSKEFREKLKQAKRVSFLAVSPLYILDEYKNELRKILANSKSEIRFLVVDPDKQAMELIKAGRPANKTDGPIFLGRLQEKPYSGAKGKLVVKKYDYVPSCIITMIDDDKSEGIIFVTIYSYKQSDPMRPSLRLTNREHLWYTFFQEEFNTLWHTGSNYKESKQ